MYFNTIQYVLLICAGHPPVSEGGVEKGQQDRLHQAGQEEGDQLLHASHASGGVAMTNNKDLKSSLLIEKNIGDKDPMYCKQLPHGQCGQGFTK